MTLREHRVGRVDGDRPPSRNVDIYMRQECGRLFRPPSFTLSRAVDAWPSFFVARRLERLTTNYPPWGRFDLIAVLLSKFGTPIQPWLSLGFPDGLTHSI